MRSKENRFGFATVLLLVYLSVSLGTALHNHSENVSWTVTECADCEHHCSHHSHIMPFHAVHECLLCSFAHCLYLPLFFLSIVVVLAFTGCKSFFIEKIKLLSLKLEKATRAPPF